MVTENKISTAIDRSVANYLKPKLRFKEFEGGWEENKLGSNINILSGFAFKSVFFSDSGNKLVIPKNFTKNGFGNFSKQFSKYTIEKVDDKYICKEDDLLILLTDLTQSCELLGKPLLIRKEDGNVLLNQRIIKIKNKENLNKNFLSYFLLTNNYHKVIKETSSGSTVRHSSIKIIQNININIPKLPEQQKIATFLTAVDTKIQQLKSRKSALETYKKGAMQQLFSQQIRFKSDDGSDFADWEEKKLGEVCDIRDGTHDSPKYKREGYPLITSKNLMKDGSMDFDNVNLISKIDFDNINKRSGVDIGDILFGMIGTIGNPVIVKNKGFAIKNVALIKENVLLKNFFLIHYLANALIQKQFYEQNTGGTQKFIALGVIRDLVIFVPSLKEQQKIANYLSAIDVKIESVNQQIKKTQAFKKGLLQQLFV